LVARTLSAWPGDETSFHLYGSSKLLERITTRLHLPSIPANRVHWSNVGPNPADGIFPIEDRRQRAEAVLATLDEACKDAKEGRISSLVTAPIDKSVVRTLLPAFTGHTEYLAEKAGVPRTLMLMDNGEIRVVLLTTHIPLRDVPRTITAGNFEEAIRIATRSFSEFFGIPNPRFALAALNPHAGETTEGAEEETIFKPVIRRLWEEGCQIEGPFPADSLFAKARDGRWDAIVSPYHDQGLVAVKYAGLDKVVNLTLGLPYLRVSPGHGVAYDLVGKGSADTRSFERALRIAATGRWMER
jgi:4-hydroxythreonine-4-phosphate dehydrogenase